MDSLIYTKFHGFIVVLGDFVSWVFSDFEASSMFWGFAYLYEVSGLYRYLGGVCFIADFRFPGFIAVFGFRGFVFLRIRLFIRGFRLHRYFEGLVFIAIFGFRGIAVFGDSPIYSSLF